MILIQPVETEPEIDGILELQRRNLRRNLTDGEAAEQGFLTAEYSRDLLQRMNAASPSILAKVDDRVIGYALVTTREVGVTDPFLAELFLQNDSLTYQGCPLASARYVVVGQLCVDRDYRGLGLVSRLYETFRKTQSGIFSFAVTEVARSNARSLRAHQKVGFQVIHSMASATTEWEIVLWDWRTPGDLTD